jgi:WD40 repeat protein
VGVWLYDTQSHEVASLLTDHTGQVTDVVFSPDGRILASVGWGNTIHLWDVVTGTLQHTLNHSRSVQRVVFSPDGQTLASRDRSSTIRLWDVVTDTLQHTLKDHTDRVTSIAFSPDGRILASAGNNTVRLWDVASGALQHTYEGHTHKVWNVAFSPDGRTLVSSSRDGTALLWDVVPGSASGVFHNLVTNPNGRWEVWKSGTTVTASFSSPRSPVQYHAREAPQPQFVLPVGFRPVRQEILTVTGTRVHADRTPVPNASPATFDLTIGTNGKIHYVDNSKVDDLGYVSYRVTRMTWQTHEVSETLSAPGMEAAPVSGTDPNQ